MRYTIYDNKTDFPIIVAGNCFECANVMGITIKSFNSIVSRACSGQVKRWTILKIDENDDEFL